VRALAAEDQRAIRGKSHYGPIQDGEKGAYSQNVHVKRETFLRAVAQVLPSFGALQTGMPRDVEPADQAKQACGTRLESNFLNYR